MHDIRVLVVEDEPLVAMALEDTLTDAGFTVISAGDASSAIQKLENEHSHIQAVVTDIRMPGLLSGWDVAYRARDLEPEMPVIYCSGDKAADWSECGVPGSVMLLKPFALEQLAVMVAEMIGAKPAGSSA
ncbi:response regulator [Devosia submarina]|uniref:response regulator n=1 Tax=Devosia submarina TaxID=1173082 RepID=UPI000D392D44|nr:response regulator [Devosia submarina]